MKRLLIALLLFSSVSVMSQESSTSGSTVNQQLWLDFVPHFFITEKLEFHGDAGFRTTVNNDSWKRYYVRPSVRYHFRDHLKFYGGIGLFYIDNSNSPNTFELRPWQGVYARWPRVTKRILFDHLLRFEERFIWQENTGSGEEFEFRIRYKLAATILFCEPCGDEYWSLPVFVEYIFPVNDVTADVFKNVFRIGAGMAYKYSKDWTFSANLIWQESAASITDREDVSDQILQLKVARLLK